uniref:Uncharacterized protein n=1 Tax=Siphoviridae sp. ctmIh35 TaxID=2827932 RepID=A0A8S5T8E6_9CAUD|nr:MAG TPA: hypothetical protein [Siphoviridae sp. ctmIh35]
MGGRGASGLSYQGKNGGSGRASSSGVNVSEMRSKLDSLSSNVLNDKRAAETIEQIQNLTGRDQNVKIYRATVGNSINQNDWVFLSKEQAERWTKTPLGRPKPGVKVIESTVKASEVDWTGKNLEFVYTGKRRRR